jgi:hypothetical protein
MPCRPAIGPAAQPYRAKTRDADLVQDWPGVPVSSAAMASFDVSDGRVTRIWAVRNPEKLRPWARDGHDLSGGSF